MEYYRLPKTLTLLFLAFPAFVLSLPQSTNTVTSNFPTSTLLDGFTAGGSTQAGAGGPDRGGITLSTGAIVGISVSIGVVVVGITTLWALWYLAKRRQWNIRESIRRASRRMTGRKDPGTPRTPRTPRTPGKKARPGTMVGPIGGRVGRMVDAEKGVTKPHAGWLADGKERSSSSSRENIESNGGARVGK